MFHLCIRLFIKLGAVSEVLELVRAVHSVRVHAFIKLTHLNLCSNETNLLFTKLT